MQVDCKNIYIDSEDEAIALGIALKKLVKDYDVARWMFLPSEWSEYVQKKVRMQNHLRKLQEKVSYNTGVPE